METINAKTKQPTFYGFCCGYLQKKESDYGHLELGKYASQKLYFVNGQYNIYCNYLDTDLIFSAKIIRENFETLKEAKKFFNAINLNKKQFISATCI